MAIVEGLSLWQFLLIACLLVIPILYQISSTFKYHFRLLFYYSMSLFIATYTILYALPRGRNPKNQRIVSGSVRLWLRPLMGIDIVIRGEELIPKDTPAIIVINHQSSVDMIPLCVFWPEGTVTLAKREIIWLTGAFGPAAWLCGTIYIDRGNSEKARKTMEETVNVIKNEKLKVVIFPEGTRNHEGSMLPFKKGAFHLAVQAQVPVIPVVFSSYDNFYSKKEKRFDQGKVIIQVLPLIPTAGLTGDDVTNLAEKTRSVMLECFERISEEVKTLK